MIFSEWIRRYSIAHFLAALVALIVATPFVEELRWGSLLEAALMTLVLLSAVAAVGEGHRTLLVAVILVTPALVGTWANRLAPDAMPRIGIAALAFVLFIIYHLLRFILRAQRVNSEVLCASIAAYLMMGIAWAMAYEWLWRTTPDAFHIADSPTGKRMIDGFEALYFSFGTLAPISDAEIVPVGKTARLLVMCEAIIGMFYMGMLIARLVGLYSSEEAAENSEPSARSNADASSPV